jgi:hypothetical protein
MSRTTKAIQRHMIPRSKAVSFGLVLPSSSANGTQRGPETFSGQVVRKLRLTLAPSQSLATAIAAG